MRDKLVDVLERYRPLLCASGHDHSLQIIGNKLGCRNYVISGAASNYTDVKPGEEDIVYYDGLGFMMVERTKAGQWDLSVISVENSGWFGPASSQKVLTFPLK